MPPRRPIDNTLFQRLHIYLAPILTTATRSALRKMEMPLRGHQLSASDASQLFMGIVRSAIETRQTKSQRVQTGLQMLLKALPVKPADLGKALRRSPAIPPPMVGYASAYLGTLLKHPVP